MTILYTTYQEFHEITDHDLVLLASSSTCKRMHSVLKEIDNEMSGTLKIVIRDLY